MIIQEVDLHEGFTNNYQNHDHDDDNNNTTSTAVTCSTAQVKLLELRLSPNQVVDPRPIEEEDDEKEDEYWTVEWTDENTVTLTIETTDMDGDHVKDIFICSVSVVGGGGRDGTGIGTGEDADEDAIQVLTISTVDAENSGGIDNLVLKFRIYDSTNETVPDFRYSTTYTYMGLDGERAPRSTVLGKVHGSVREIQWFAFYKCNRMKWCIMDDNNSGSGSSSSGGGGGDDNEDDDGYSGVETIADFAFEQCTSLCVIQFSRALRFIGACAFYQCTSIHALFLPPTLEEVENGAFGDCDQLRIVTLFTPRTTGTNLNLGGIQGNVFHGCHALFEIDGVIGRDYEYESDDEDEEYPTNHELVHRSIMNVQRTLPPFHKVCLDACGRVNVQNIQEYAQHHGVEGMSLTDDHYGMNPLHLLVMNPHTIFAARPEVIMAYMTSSDAPLDVILAPDGVGRSPLDYVRMYGHLEIHTYLIRVLCLHREAWKGKNLIP